MKMKKDYPKVYKAWKEWYKATSDDPQCEDWNFEGVCVGFVMALGLSLEEAVKFYQEMIQEGLF